MGFRQYMVKLWERGSANSDASPTAAKCPFLDEDAQEGGITLAQAITNFGNERTTLHASLKAIEIVRLDTREAIDAAANVAAVDAVMAAIAWPA